ncbi:MAG TPA: hypothetical protein VL475_13590, partial [Planctomycetaceae bacterium]|nr:hypothetical protein [Planctomycetaceae bacterium]
RPRPEIESIDGQTGAVQSGAEFARAGTEFEGEFAGEKQTGQSSHHPAVVPGNSIRDAQIPSVVQRRGVIHGQRIKQLGLQKALHERRRLPAHPELSSVPASP